MRLIAMSAAFVCAMACALLHDPQPAAAEAGPILSSRDQVAILGDSYSAGEGADVYLDGSDTDANPCHRSVDTYLVKALRVDPERIVACSGAVVNDVYFPQPERTVVSQIEQLINIRDHGGVDAVFLTLGGNDAGFATIAASCIVRNCAKRIYADPFAVSGRSSAAFVDEHLSALPDALRTAYLTLNYAVNGPEARRLGGPVPIFVLAYPLATPERPRNCPQMYESITAGESDFLNRLGVRLNDTIESAVAEAREQDGVPIFFVRDTEAAFRPDHTLCDPKPLARTLASFNGAGRQPALAKLGRDRDFWEQFEDDPIEAVRTAVRDDLIGGVSTGLRELRLGLRELCHPSQAGYAAISAAVLSWSQSAEAREAVGTIESAPTAAPPPPPPAAVAGLVPSGDSDADCSFLLPLLIGVAVGAIAVGAVVVIRR